MLFLVKKNWLKKGIAEMEVLSLAWDRVEVRNMVKIGKIAWHLFCF